MIDIRDKFLDYIFNHYLKRDKEYFEENTLSDEEIDYFMQFISIYNYGILLRIIMTQTLSIGFASKYIGIIKTIDENLNRSIDLISPLCAKQKLSYEFIKSNLQLLKSSKIHLLNNPKLDKNIIEEIFEQYGDLL